MNLDAIRQRLADTDHNWPYTLVDEDIPALIAEVERLGELECLVRQYLMRGDHYFECIHGGNGGAPDNKSCSPLCIALRRALTTPGDTQREETS